MNRYTWRTGVREGAMILVALVFLFPIYILVNMAIRLPSDPTPAIIPTAKPTLDNFFAAWTEGNLGSAWLVTIALMISSVLVIVVVSALASFTLARATAGWSTWLYYVFMVGLLLPVQIAMVPLYKNMVALGLAGSPVALFLLYVGLRLPFSIFLYVQFMRQLPVEYEEAATIDGASAFGVFRRIVFPLMRPVTGVVVILNGLFIFNDFLSPLLYLTGTKYQTLTVSVFSFVGEYTSNWNLVFAALIIAALPMLIVYFFLQRTLIQGFASGIKG